MNKQQGTKKLKVLWEQREMELCPRARGLVAGVAEIDLQTGDAESLRERIGNYDAYFAGTDIRLDREILARAKRLKVVATSSTGTDHIDVKALAEKGIPLLALTTEYEVLDKFTATAEGGWGLLLACVRRIPACLDAVRRGEWRWTDFPRPRQLSEKTLGVLGVGRLGKMVVEYGKAFRMRVLGCDLKKIDIPGVEQVDFETMLRESDVISINIHLNDETRGLISREALTQMKDGVVIVNTSRGAIIDEQALVEALESGKVSAAGLDVIEGEWMEDIRQHPLVRYAQKHDNLVITPHTASNTVESVEGGRMFIAQKLADFLRELGKG